MDQKYVSMFLLLGIIFVSLFLSSYSFLVSSHSASIFGREGMANRLVGTSFNGAPVNTDAESSLMSAASYTTSGQSNASRLEASQASLHPTLGVSSSGPTTVPSLGPTMRP